MDTYLTPAAADAATSPAPVPAYGLFDASSVFIASVLGSPVAGATLMALNYRRMGKAQRGTIAVVIGVAATVLGSVLGYFVPSSANIVVAIGLALGTKSAAQYLQGADVNQHEVRGGALSSR